MLNMLSTWSLLSEILGVDPGYDTETELYQASWNPEFSKLMLF